MEYQVVDKININRKRCQKVGAFLYDPVVDGLYLDCPWWFPVQIGFTNGLSNALVTKGFLKLPFILKGWVNHDILLREIELIKLVLAGSILMHGSCVDDTMIVGLPNSGKTYRTFKLRSEGGKLISEEYTVITKDKNVLSYKPYTRTCLSARTIKDCNVKLTPKEKVWLFLATIRAKLMPFMFEAVIWKEYPVSGIANKINKIVYGSSGKEIKDWKVFALLCENEFPFMASEFLQAYMLASGFNLLEIQEKQRLLIKEFVESVYPNNGK